MPNIALFEPINNRLEILILKYPKFILAILIQTDSKKSQNTEGS